MKYSGSWPPVIKNSIQIDGCGPNRSDEFHELGEDRIFCSEEEPFAHLFSLKPAKNWKNMSSQIEKKSLEGKIKYYSKAEKHKELYVLVLHENGKYGKVLLAKEKDTKNPVATLLPGEWSEWLFEEFNVKGKNLTGTIRFKLLSLSLDGNEVRIYSTPIFPTRGFTVPDELSQELIDKFGPFLQRPGWPEIAFSDDETFMELIDYQNKWFANASAYLMKNYSWDLYFLQAHCIDYAQHRYLNTADPISGASLEEAKKAMNYLKKVYKSCDEMIGKIVKAVDDDTLVVIVSDHGAKAHISEPPVAKILEDAGLLVFDKKPGALTTRRELAPELDSILAVDWSKTKAVPQRSCYIYVNLKGRDPQGIVEPGEEYEQVRNKVIDALLSYKDPKTGKHPYALALRREDAKIIGLKGNRIGDIVYALNPEFGHEHGQQLPTARYGMGTMEAVLIMSGPGIKKNYKLKSIRWLVDVAPTISYMMNMPPPRDAEGSVIYDALKEPDAQYRYMEKLKHERNKWKQGYKAIQSITHRG